MFSLVKHECESCMEEHDCVHCTRCKSYYCRECIIDYNNCNKTTGLCPTCKSKYGMMNNYYIYGTNVLPLLSAQIDKYRERIQSSGDYKLQAIFDQLKRDANGNICTKRSMLLQLYLNRLYRDQHPTETDIFTWAKGIHEATPIITLLNNFADAVALFTKNHTDKSLQSSIREINDKYNHIDWVIGNVTHNDNSRRNLVYFRTLPSGDQSPLHHYRYYDLHNQEVLLEFIEEEFDLTETQIGAAKAALSAHSNIEVDSIHYFGKSREYNPNDYGYKLEDFEQEPVLTTAFSGKTVDYGWNKFVPYRIRVKVSDIEILPTIHKFSDVLSTGDIPTELGYYNELSKAICTKLDDIINRSYQNKIEIDESYYSLMHSALSVHSYTTRTLHPSDEDLKRAETLMQSVVSMLKEESFDMYGFMNMMSTYYTLACQVSWNNDIGILVEEIRRQIFNDSAVAESFDRAVRPILEPPMKPRTRLIGAADSKVYFVKLPEMIHVNLTDVLKKNPSTHKLSFIRCVCGGSVIATPSGATTVYECTRCHKQLDALPEQEMDPETVKLLESISKKCPVCGTYIQKAEGCNHMFCTNCKNGFNWDDLSRLDDAHNTNPHFHEHRHGNVSNLRSLLDDYDRPANRARDPIEWFCNKLYVDMKDAEGAIKLHRESVGYNTSKFVRDDTFAMKFANELNIKKMRVNYIQSTFDKIMAEAFNVVRENGNDQRTLRSEYKKIVNRFLRNYENGKTMLTQIQDGLSVRIDYAIEEAHRMSQVGESAELVTDEMEAEELAMEEALKAQLNARIEEMDKHSDDVIVIGNHRISVRRS